MYLELIPRGLREPVSNWFDRMSPGVAELDDATRERLARVVASSEYAAMILQREWSWFVDNHESLDSVPDTARLERLVDEIRVMDDLDTAKERIRRFRHRWLLQVLWRESAGVATLEETLTALSDLADRLLGAAADLAAEIVRQRCGDVHNGSGDRVSLVVLGMGKLGGRELNFSSDIDLIFLYPEGGDSDGQKCLSAQEYFTRVSRQVVALLDEVTADGFAFRIDTRLRPFGDSGPPVTSFAALESYLLQHGREWERYAYIKARIVGPSVPKPVADELMHDLITPFVYRRYLDYGAVVARGWSCRKEGFCVYCRDS
jgi:glutamate-ammonia-ligase adenylyltransferase